MIRLCIAMGAVAALAGCETMLYHIRLTDQATVSIAQGNAHVNECLARNLVNRQLAYEFSSISAQTLDITVLNRDLYKSTYETQAARARSIRDSNLDCEELNRELPRINKQMTAQYMNFSQSLSAGRAAESRQMLATMNGFSQNMASFGTSNMSIVNKANDRTPYWPKVGYSDAKPETLNYLVNTSKGAVQCRVTNKNYVFCM